MSDPITIVRWRDARTDPPKDNRQVWTDDGGMTYFEGAEPPARKWQDEWPGADPTVWCNPVPPGADPLTLDDLRLILPAAQDTAARLRDIEHPDANEYAAALERVRNALKGAKP